MIRRAVIPAAGYGTRLLPITKSLPKEMLPVVDRPVIQYVVEEAAAAGLRDILIVISRGKRAIEEFFDRHAELETLLDAKGQASDLEALRQLSGLARIHFDWQQTISGLGDAIACARDHVGNEPFAVLLGDTLVEAEQPAIGQLISLHRRHRESVVALEEVPPEKISRYGVIRGTTSDGRVYSIDKVVEKPPVEYAPSGLAVAGRYVLAPEIFDILERTPPGRNGEVQLTDALNELAAAGRLTGLRIDGRRYDVGSRLDWLRANVSLALGRNDLAREFRLFLTEMLHPSAAGSADGDRAAHRCSVPDRQPGGCMKADDTESRPGPLAGIFRRHLENSIACGDLLRELFLNISEPASLVVRIKQLEEIGDKLTAAVYEALASVPDSELVQLNEQFAKHLDDIIDGMNTTARTIDVFMPAAPEQAGQELAEVIIAMLLRLHAEVRQYPDNSLDSVRECRAALKRWEENADVIYHEWRKDHRQRGRLSLRAETDWTELLGIMEQTTDSCYHAALLLERLTRHRFDGKNGEIGENGPSAES